MTDMSMFPLQDQPSPSQDRQSSGHSEHWFHRLARFGLGEILLRFGTNLLTLLVVLGIAILMQNFYARGAHAEVENAAPVAEAAAPPTLALIEPLEPIANASEGIPRLADPSTVIPSRPRVDVITYTVQPGDTIFGIAEKFGLKPSTILFGNYEILRDNPHSLRPGQELRILPVDGTYYRWVGGGAETLTGVAAYFGVTPEDIINYPGNRLDPEQIGSYDNPNIPPGTWLIIPGGRREFTSWTAPMVIINEPASTRVWGPGACGVINRVQVGYGTFVWPAPKHWLSGTPYLPEIRHPAIDIAGALGDAVFATDAGTVVYAGWNDWGYGNLIVLDHGNGWQSLYAHLSQVNVVCGQNVGQGEIIGLIGSTGNSTGPHLHFELMHRQYGKVNPLNFLPPP